MKTLEFKEISVLEHRMIAGKRVNATTGVEETVETKALIVGPVNRYEHTEIVTMTGQKSGQSYTKMVVPEAVIYCNGNIPVGAKIPGSIVFRDNRWQYAKNEEVKK